MFRWLRSGAFWGALLILAGVLFLLENLEILEIADIFWAILFGLAGLFFFTWFFTNRENWWALIPGFIFAALGVVIALETLLPETADDWVGPVFLASIGLPFLLIFLLRREHWWAIIPAGVMLTLAVVAGVDQFVNTSLGTGGIFFIGLGLTFAVVALVPTQSGRMSWAWIPSGALVLMGILVFAAAEDLIDLILPLALIVGGLYLLIITFRPRRA